MKLCQVQVSLNIARNHSSSLWYVISGRYCPQVRMKSGPIMKLGQVIIFPNFVLSTIIWPILSPFVKYIYPTFSLVIHLGAKYMYVLYY